MFKFEDNKMYHMPTFAGGIEFDPDAVGRVNDVLTIQFTQTTDGRRLADYLPKGFKLLRPELIIKYVQMREVEFMNGGSYNLVGIYVPARFNGKRDNLEANYPLVIWENKTKPILGGREDSGQPKIYADIEDLHIFENKYFSNASYEGNKFLSIEMVDPQPVDEQTLGQMKAGSVNANVFGFRYIPKIGAPGADLIQPILYPQSFDLTGAWIGKGSVQWTKLRQEFPYDNLNEYASIRALAKLPIEATTSVMMFKGISIMKAFAGYVLK